MTMMHCERFDELLPDLLEDTLGAEQREAARAHLGSCVRCAGLVADLDAMRTGAASLPELSPSRDLWTGIASRIESPVADISGGARRMPPGERRVPRVWLAAAAAVLMLLSSATTYWFTRAPAPTVVASAGPVERPMASAPRPESSAVAAAPAPELAGPATTPSATHILTARRRTPDAASLDATYEREVVALRKILAQRSEQLDPRTVAILEASLKMIDQAILQSRQALAADPASSFLREQLNKALDRKVDVLRTAALLPART